MVGKVFGSHILDSTNLIKLFFFQSIVYYLLEEYFLNFKTMKTPVKNNIWKFIYYNLTQYKIRGIRRVKHYKTRYYIKFHIYYIEYLYA